MSAEPAPLAAAAPAPAANLPLSRRRIDLFFALVFATFTVTSGIADLVPTPDA